MAFRGNALIHILFSEMKRLAPFDKIYQFDVKVAGRKQISAFP